MEEFHIYFRCQTKKANCFIFDLGYKSFVLITLCSYELCNKVFSIGFSYSFRLTVKDICQVVVIFLLGKSYFNEGQNKHTT